MNKKILAAVAISGLLVGCGSGSVSGKTCLGQNGETLIERMAEAEQCQRGDTIMSKVPASFCNYNYDVSFNNYGVASCIYSGKLKDERVK